MNPVSEASGSNLTLYHNELIRLQTFVDWPNPAVRPEDLSKAGFIHVYGDRVQCVYCKGILEYWEEGDVPLDEHRKHFPRCPFLPRGIDVAGTGLPPKALRSRKISVLVNNNVIQHHAPKYPKYGSLESRLQSFSSWPIAVNKPKNTNYLAEAGFFYSGNMDLVNCFHCGQGLNEWEETDDPWEEHVRSAPMCELLLLKKGQAYVEKVKRQLSAESAILEENEIIMGMNQSNIEREKITLPLSQKMAAVVVQAMEKHGLVESPGASNDMEPLAENSDVTKQESRCCIVCTIQERCVTFLPCGHFSTCADCTLMLSDCPVCRQQIQTVVKTYMP